MLINVIKLFFGGGDLRFLQNGKIICSSAKIKRMSFYAKLNIIAYFVLFQLSGIPRFSRFPHKRLYNIDYTYEGLSNSYQK